MQPNHSLIDEIEEAIHSGSQERRIDTLRRVTDLFLADADRLNDQQIAVFDDVLGHLIKRIEAKAMIELSLRLAPVDNAPIEVIRRLARDDEIAVAGPVLNQSARLTTGDLVEIAKTKSQEHLAAISGRRHVEEAVTDVLLDRGNREVRHKLAKNGGARFSDAGFGALVKDAETDETLAEKIGVRIDLPLQLLRQLLLKATEAVRSRLLAIAPPETREEVRRVLGKIANQVGQESVAAPRDFTEALRVVAFMQTQGTLNEAALLAFAKGHDYEKVVAALSALCSVAIELITPLIRSVRTDGMLVACKAAGLEWSTVQAILEIRVVHHRISEPDPAQVKADYHRLTQGSAQRTIRFWNVRQGVAKRFDA